MAGGKEDPASLRSGGGGSGPAPRKPAGPPRPGAQPRSEPARRLRPLAPDARGRSPSPADGRALGPLRGAPPSFVSPRREAPLPVRARGAGSGADGGLRLIYAGTARREAPLPDPEKDPLPSFGGDGVCKHAHTCTRQFCCKRRPDSSGPAPTHTQHLGRRITQSRSASMEPPLRICKSKSEIKPPPTSSSSASLSTSSSSSSSQP